MASFQDVRAARKAKRSEALDAAWSLLQRELAGSGIEMKRFGSSSRQSAMAHSDLDVMVLGEPDIATRSLVDRVAARIAQKFEIPYDLHFARDYSPEDLKEILS